MGTERHTLPVAVSSRHGKTRTHELRYGGVKVGGKGKGAPATHRLDRGVGQPREMERGGPAPAKGVALVEGSISYPRALEQPLQLADERGDRELPAIIGEVLGRKVF